VAARLRARIPRLLVLDRLLEVVFRPVEELVDLLDLDVLLGGGETPADPLLEPRPGVSVDGHGTRRLRTLNTDSPAAFAAPVPTRDTSARRRRSG
jgi:hypothetical protein